MPIIDHKRTRESCWHDLPIDGQGVRNISNRIGTFVSDLITLRRSIYHGQYEARVYAETRVGEICDDSHVGPEEICDGALFASRFVRTAPRECVYVHDMQQQTHSSICSCCTLSKHCMLVAAVAAQNRSLFGVCTCNTPPPSKTRRSPKEAANMGQLRSVQAFIHNATSCAKARRLCRVHKTNEFTLNASDTHCSCPAAVTGRCGGDQHRSASCSGKIRTSPGCLEVDEASRLLWWWSS